MKESLRTQTLPRKPIVLRPLGTPAEPTANGESALAPKEKEAAPVITTTGAVRSAISLAEKKKITEQFTSLAPLSTPSPTRPSSEPAIAKAPEPIKPPEPEPTAPAPAPVAAAPVVTTTAAPAGLSAQQEAELKALRIENTNLRTNIENWTQAEAEWSQQRRLFQVMTDNISDLIVMTDSQGHRMWNNPAYAALLGYSEEELIGTYSLSEFHPDEQARAAEALKEAVENGQAHQGEFRVQQKNGNWMTLQVDLMPVVDVDSKVEAVLLICRDVTEKKKLEEALALASTEATAAGMVEAMARDFDQILTNVVGNVTIAKNLNGPHNAVAVRLNEIERSLQRARDLIEQMFSITPSNAAPKVRVQLEQAVQEAASSVLRGTMVRAEYLFGRNLPDLEVDQEAFSHAIRNIVTNSLQAMDKGVVRFTAENIPREQLSFRPDLPLKPNDYLCLHVQDQGHGISEKSLPRVFEPYFTTRNGSQGLGLTTALSSIQRMGGTILIDSTPGVGTTVSVYIPAASGPSTASAATPAASTGAAHGSTSTAASRTGPLPKPGQKKRILLMDDEQMILDIVSRMLGHLGYEVTTCTDGSQAIAAFAKGKSQGESFDVVVMDLIIPNGVGGQDAVHTIKKIDPGARVIASSGHLDHPVMLDFHKFGFNAVLEKPYKLEKLQQVIEAVISAPAA